MFQAFNQCLRQLRNGHVSWGARHQPNATYPERIVGYGFMARRRDDLVEFVGDDIVFSVPIFCGPEGLSRAMRRAGVA